MKKFIDFFNGSPEEGENERQHAIKMLTIYGIFIIIIIAVVRTTPINEKETPKQSTKKIEPKVEEKAEEKVEVKKTVEYDVNYSYSYKITFDNQIENYLGKKVDEKEKFSYIKDGITFEYAILNDNYLLLENGTYHVTDKLNTYFKYCDIEKIISLTSNEESVLSENKYTYNISNTKLADIFGDSIIVNNNNLNQIEIVLDSNNLKTINMNFSNYITSVLDSNHSLIINMEFANVGTTEDFNIKLN